MSNTPINPATNQPYERAEGGQIIRYAVTKPCRGGWRVHFNDLRDPRDLHDTLESAERMAERMRDALGVDYQARPCLCWPMDNRDAVQHCFDHPTGPIRPEHVASVFMDAHGRASPAPCGVDPVTLAACALAVPFRLTWQEASAQVRALMDAGELVSEGRSYQYRYLAVAAR